jgi:hypothetical protein
MITLKPIHIRRLVEAEIGGKINTKSRRRDLVEGRHLFCYILRKHTKLSLATIAKEIDRDHTSVLHSIRRAKEFLLYDQDFRDKFYNLEDKFSQLSGNNFEKFLGKEDKLQNAVMSYISLQHPKVLTIHVPNEGRRTPFERFKFKYLGGKSGIPDVLCFENRGGFSGLAIELKVGYNKPTESQLECLKMLEDGNWSAHWCSSFDKAKEVIDNYFDKRIDLNV